MKKLKNAEKKQKLQYLLTRMVCTMIFLNFLTPFVDMDWFLVFWIAILDVLRKFSECRANLKHRFRNDGIYLRHCVYVVATVLINFYFWQKYNMLEHKIMSAVLCRLISRVYCEVGIKPWFTLSEDMHVSSILKCASLEFWQSLFLSNILLISG